MKKIFVLLSVLAFTLCGCGKAASTAKEKTVKEKKEPKKSVLSDRFTEYPNYALPEGATPDQIRQMAVKAMHDEITIPWYISENVNYYKNGAGDDKTFTLNKGEIYCGLPYTNGNNGLFHWLNYYNFETGEISGINSADINYTLGNSCAASVMWGWSAVATSFKWNTTATMTPKNGALPVGGYKISPSMITSGGLDTKGICAENGEQAMYAAYTAVKAGDAIMGNHSDGHVLMSIADAMPKYLSNGNIDPENSFIYVHDQRMGHTSTSDNYIIYTDDGVRHFAGRTSASLTFGWLYRNGFIAVTAAEFEGTKPYTVPTAVCDGAKSANTFQKLSTLSVKSDYKIVSISLSVTDAKSKKVVATDKILTIRSDTETGKNHNYPLSAMFRKKALTEKLKSGTTYNFKVEALISTGQTFTVIDNEIKY